jgi:hypothetical protein
MRGHKQMPIDGEHRLGEDGHPNGGIALNFITWTNAAMANCAKHSISIKCS